MEEVNDTPQEVERVSWFGYQSFIFSLVRALTIGIGTYIIFSTSQVDTDISVVIGLIIALIPLGMFIGISKNRYQLDIVDLNVKFFGKIFGNVLNFILNIVFLFLGSIVLYAVSQYIDIQYIPNTTSIYVKMLIMMPIVYAATKSIATIARISQVVLFVNLGIFLLSVIGLTTEFDIDNLFPMFYEDIGSIIYSGVVFALSISAPIFLMTIIPQSKVTKEKYSSKKIIMFFLFSALIVITIIVTTILILGIDIINIYRYPIFMALRQFSFFTIIGRLERFLSLQFLNDIFIYLILTIHFVSASITKVIKAKNNENIFAYIIGAIILLIATLIFSDSIKVNNFITKFYVYLLGIGIILPMFFTYIATVIDNIKYHITLK